MLPDIETVHVAPMLPDTDVDRLVVHKKVELDGLMNRPSNLDKLSTCRPSVARIMC